MGKKILDILERYIDKLVLGFIGIICLALLWFFVISSPYAVKYKNKKISPGKIDELVLREAKGLENKMNEPPVRPSGFQSNADSYLEQIASSLDFIEENAFVQMPLYNQVAKVDDRSYIKPEIPEIENLEVEWYRTVVHMPVEPVDPMNRYDLVGNTNTSEPVDTERSDIDLITVSGSIDLSKLKRNFRNSFNSPLFNAEYRSPEMAEPLFADVQIQRQQLTSSGWSEWEVVSRTKVDPFKSLIASIPEKITKEHIGGINLLMSNYDASDIQTDVVQARNYEFASSLDLWLPPSYHDEYVKLMKQQWNDQKEQIDLERRSNRGNNARNGGGVADQRGAALGAARRAPAAATRRDPREVIKDPEEVVSEAEEVILDPEKGVDAAGDTLVVWANDDTIQPNKTYRYRMRVGVFNPTAGKGWFGNKDDSDSVVLWSEYTGPTDAVRIDKKVYLFPLDMTRDEGAVTIKLAKFYMGKWRTADFDVVPGQVIGGFVVKTDTQQTQQDNGYGLEDEPVDVDYTTDMILVDVVPMTDLIGSTALRERHYSDVLYTEDQTKIERMPTKRTNWPEDIREIFDDVRASEERPMQFMERGQVGMGGETFNLR